MTEPKRIGKYEILEELGRGGFAVVYKARDTVLERIVALKVLHPYWSEDADFTARFRREARSAARLRHPNVVTIFETGETDGQLYIAMEYLPGRTLQELLEAEGILPLERALPILEQIADALDYAHRQEMVHRDVKPGNVVVEETEDGVRATLTDFGLVKAAGGGSRLTSQGTLLGSPEYMAPEQADPEQAARVGPAADRYAFGIIAYQMLTGRVPFPGNTPATLNAHEQKPVPPPRSLHPELSQPVDEALLKMLAKDPAGRYGSARRFVAALEKESISPPHRFPWWAWALIGFALAAIAGIVLGLRLSRPSLTIESHRDGGLVDRAEVITGTYRNLNVSHDLWSIVQSESGDYWVNDRFSPTARRGTWQLETLFGYVGTRSVGERFVLLLLAVEEGSDAEKVLENAGNASGRVTELPTERVRILNEPGGLTLVRASPGDAWLTDFWPNGTWSGEPAATQRITTTYLFREWWEPPVDELPESGWTARFVRRISFPEDGEYCFHRVSDERSDVFVDSEPLELPHDDEDWTKAGSGCRELEAGEHDVRVDLANLADEESVIELWYDGPGVRSPAESTSGVWQAHFFPTPDLTGEPVWISSLPGPALDFRATTGGEIPVVNFGAVFSRTFHLTETGTYRFELSVDDGARLEICGNEVLDEFHWGPGTYTVERHLEAGEHMLTLDYYESHQAQYATLSWRKVPTPVPPIQRILFASDRDGDYDVYVMDANGANPVNLTDNTAWDAYPAWSPDGQRIVFTSDRGGSPALHVMDADGGNARSLGVTGYQPRWSPDGSRIVFMEGPEQAWEIYVMDADGANLVQLTENEVADFSPSWSPDGSRILFETDRDGNEEIYVMNADGGDPVNLSQHEAWDGAPSWSPDGETIAFFSNRDGNNEIYLMDADGSNQRRLTYNDDVRDEFPTWSPDGRFLAFEGDNQIYRNDVEGARSRVPLTAHYAEHGRPHWSPPGYGYTFENLTDGDDVHEQALAVAGDYVWTGGDGGLVRWDREDPDRQVKFTSEDGLAENNVHALLAESETTLWVGTGGWPFDGSGLSRYDFGEERDHWRTFTAGDGLGSNTIFDLYRDSQGRIWAGTTDGVRVYEGGRWRGFEETEDHWVRSLFEASDGVFWIGTSGAGIVRYDPAASDEAAWRWFDPITLGGSDDEGYGYVLDIVEGAPGELWFATHGGVVYYDAAGSGVWQVLTGTLDVWTYAAVRDVDGALWFGTDNGLVRRDADGERVYTSGDGLTGDVHALALDDEGVLWAAGNGLSRYDREEDRWHGYRAHDDQAYNYVSAIVEDREGVFWLGHSIFRDYVWYGGVSRYRPRTGTWTHFGEYSGLSAEGVHTILQDREGIIWFGFDRAGGGVCRYDPDDREWLPCYRADPNGLVTDTVDAIAETPDGALWFGTSGGGLSRFDGERWETFTRDDSGLLSDQVHCLAADDEGTLWISTDAGVNRFFYETGEWVPFTTGNSDLIADEVLAMALDGSDGIWFGTREGLSRYDLEDRKWRNVEGRPALASWVDNCSQALHVDRHGSLWVGSGEGLYRSTPEGGWVRLTPAEGLASNHVLAIFEDADGTFWVGTPSGVSRVTVGEQ